MQAMNTENLQNLSEDRICNLAFWGGYTIRTQMTNINFSHEGKRIGGSFAKVGPDAWMNTANVRLWQIQKNKALPWWDRFR